MRKRKRKRKLVGACAWSVNGGTGSPLWASQPPSSAPHSPSLSDSSSRAAYSSLPPWKCVPLRFSSLQLQSHRTNLSPPSVIKNGDFYGQQKSTSRYIDSVTNTVVTWNPDPQLSCIGAVSGFLEVLLPSLTAQIRETHMLYRLLSHYSTWDLWHKFEQVPAGRIILINIPLQDWFRSGYILKHGTVEEEKKSRNTIGITQNNWPPFWWRQGSISRHGMHLMLDIDIGKKRFHGFCSREQCVTTYMKGRPRSEVRWKFDNSLSWKTNA